MKIVVLDGYVLNPGDLSWNALKLLGDCTIYERTAPEDVVSRAIGAEVVLTNKTPMSADTIRQLTSLRYIGVLATGYNTIDVTAANAVGIVVSNVPAYGTASVAQHVFALLLELTNHVAHHASSVASGGWSRCKDWCYWIRDLRELHGSTFGIVGYGRVGQSVAAVAQAFGMKTLVASRRNRGQGFLTLEEVLQRSHVVSLHCPLTPETRGLIDSQRLSLMRPDAILINTSRGDLVIEHDLAEALNEGRLAGAAVDVLSSEPPTSNNPLLRARNCIITPHQAWATLEARKRLLDTAVENIAAFVAGIERNKVEQKE